MDDLHPTQVNLLRLLKESFDDPLSIRELQESLNLSSPSLVHHHILQLEKKGYLKRNPRNTLDYQLFPDEPEKKLAYLNLYDLAHCGPRGSLLDGNPAERIPISTALLSFPAREGFLVQAKGGSMRPRIWNGDFVIAQKAQAIIDKAIMVCVNEGEALIKQVNIQKNNVLLLISLNPEYAPIVTTTKKFHVEGIVKGVISRNFE
jgi:repressor LexA